MRTLIENLEFVLTVDKADTVLSNASVVIDGERFSDIGPAAVIAARHGRESFDRIVDGSRFGMTPGFVDSHVHLSETLSRAVFPDCLATRAWVFHWAKPFYANVTGRDEVVGATLGMAEMLRCGTTCFLDMGAQSDVRGVVEAIDRIGMRGITGRHAADVRPDVIPPGWTEEMMAHHFFPDHTTALAALERTVKDFDGAGGGRVRVWCNIEGKEPCSLELHVGARALAERLGVGTTYHLATSIEEAHVCERKHGHWPISRVAAAGGLSSNLVIAHCVAVQDEEVALMADAGTKVAFCPATAVKLAKGATRIGKYPEMMAAGMDVGLGTDGVSAGGTMNLMRQLYMVAGMFKDSRMDSTLVGARKALRMATIEGAQALGWADEIGSIEIGKRADLVLFDLDHFEWVPYGDPLQAVVYSSSPASIAQTWVNGRALFENGRVVTVDEKSLHVEARRRAADVVRRAGLVMGATPVVTTTYD
ncbi:amidohydrolase family protein [Rhodoplanes roseus]|uniref:Amidohydrolase n=1 Tax=Rhodoplanes roseus TaxID=29409 RepID=A0A327KVQ6_9BRAD|nr:amidohydrolase family protein [Rhodoplanes roseus]RAI41282.1 amidohydrolase [Rhodoplanes roseus]